jgi:cell division septation protein DedD
MNYDFSFSKKATIFALAGFVFVGGLLFIAGLLIGTSWKAEPNAAANVAAQQPATAPAPPPPAPQPEPVTTTDLSRPEVAPLDLSAALNTPAPVRQAHGNAASIYSRREPAYMPASPDNGELKIIQEAEASASETAETTAYSVQVGVFASENDAHQLVRQLQKKGYTPIVLAAQNDDKSRLQYAVRIGAYRSKTEAAQAASNISDQEKLQAIVRPLGSL